MKLGVLIPSEAGKISSINDKFLKIDANPPVIMLSSLDVDFPFAGKVGYLHHMNESNAVIRLTAVVCAMLGVS